MRDALIECNGNSMLDPEWDKREEEKERLEDIVCYEDKIKDLKEEIEQKEEELLEKKLELMKELDDLREELVVCENKLSDLEIEWVSR